MVITTILKHSLVYSEEYILGLTEEECSVEDYAILDLFN